MPRWLRLALRAVGLLAWLWIVAQSLTGGSSDADVASLFLWVYGWVGLALVSAFLGPVWSWLDPFTTIYDIVAAVGRRLGLHGLEPQPWPQRLGLWAAVAGLTFFIWLELVARVLQGRPLALVLLGYTAITLLAMAQYGRDPWRQPWRDVHRLVRGPGPDGAVRADRQPGGRAGRVPRIRVGSHHEPLATRGRGHGRPGNGRHHLRRPVADDRLLRALRVPVDRRSGRSSWACSWACW